MNYLVQREESPDEFESLQTQERLNYIASYYAKADPVPNLSGIIAQLSTKYRKMALTFIFHGEITPEIEDMASVMATEIFVQFSCDWLEEDYIRVDEPHPLPESPYLTYVCTENRDA